MKPWQNTSEKSDPTESDPLLPSSSADVEKNLAKKGGNAASSSTNGGAGSSDSSHDGIGQKIDNLRSVFGTRFLVMISAVQHMLKGFVLALEGQSRPYLYKSFHVPAPQMQIYDGVTQIAWAVKPVLGMLSDLLPIGGKNKTPYMIMSSIWGGAAFLYIGILPKQSLTVIAIVICIFLVNMQGSVCDLLSEAKYAEKIQQHPAHGPDMLSFVWLGLQLAGVLALGLATLLISVSPQFSYLVCAIPAFFIIVPLVLGYMEEQTQSAEDVAETRRRFYEQGETSFLCIIMLFATVVISASGLLTPDPYINFMVSLIVFAVVLISFSVLLSPTVAKFNAFSLIQTALGISISGASFYFYTDTSEQYPEGPHFTTFFYTFVMGSGGAAMSVIGVLTYSRFLSNWSYRSLLIMTNLAASFLSFLDILMFTRTNLKMGIPDHVFIMGNGGLETMIYQWQWMPQVVILSYMCPQGMEATMYALLAGCHNLGMTISGNFGAMVLDMLKCHPAGNTNEGAQFENFWIAALISSILPLAVVIFLFKLIPERRQDENLLCNNSVTEGSLWQRWRGRGEQASEPAPTAVANE